MTVHCLNQSTARSVVTACLVGVAMSVPVLVVCLVSGGGGQGSLLPMHSCFGPIWLVWMVMPGGTGSSFLELWLAMLAMFSLYGLYGGLIAWARSQRAGGWAVVGILVLHYATVAGLVWRFEPTDRLPNLADTFARLPLLFSLAATLLFFALHVLMCQYARSARPYRPRWTWPVAVTLFSGLVVGLAFHVWGLSRA